MANNSSEAQNPCAKSDTVQQLHHRRPLESELQAVSYCNSEEHGRLTQVPGPFMRLSYPKSKRRTVPLIMFDELADVTLKHKMMSAPFPVVPSYHTKDSEAKRLITQYFATVSQRPTKKELTELLAQVVKVDPKVTLLSLRASFRHKRHYEKFKQQRIALREEYQHAVQPSPSQ